MRFQFRQSLVSLCLSTAMLTTATLPLSPACRGQELGFEPYPSTLAALMLADAAPQALPNLQPPASSGPVQLPELSSADTARNIPGANAAQSNDSNTAGAPATQGARAEQLSNNALTPLQNRKLSLPVQVVDLSVAGLGTGILPESAADAQVQQTHLVRAAAFKCVHWHPSSICHYPLRFEETMLERHGHVRFGCWQPLASGVRFFATIPMLPYISTLRPPLEPVYALGTYRPGSSAPLLRDSLPYDQHAAVAEALALSGFFWAMPL
jgi:hypothetical protein